MTLGTESAVVPAAPEAVLATIRSVLEAKRYRVTDAPPGGRITFVTRKTMLNWELDGIAQVAPVQGGTQVSVTLQSRSDRPQALMDGSKNAKAAKKLVKEIVEAG
ncbi:hypothetical protein Bcav_0273 [Beutenbergia cavernae DSM 12333]|uniref:DUF1499 domain-containing protein n=1 Tax=Beutenbergia cavernae (strain ATCC BAA-8 / DSM 12333 / CCUG 43141 / JCM 11478 / NBRC 16432 / NCIMB 13614 / HKI 0122) TaxID=471853 RepID=C5BW80_BEUC1|nr:hypothetical protein [Beutenbergia cavernae]ACQ78538.1 hypothetical protein Bcav_0273 [Beutenbergia cavernae DSM 12333]